MPRNKNLDERIKIIHECLAYRKQVAWTRERLIAEIEKKFEESGNFDRRIKKDSKISESTFYNDINYLRKKYQAPLVCKHGRYYYADAFTFSPATLEVETLKKFTKILALIKNIQSETPFSDLDDLLNQLQMHLHVNAADNKNIVRFEHHPIQQGLKKYFTVLFEAIDKRAETEIRYQRFSDLGAKSFLVYPYLLKEFKHRWYLVARLKKTGQIITLSLDRIKEVFVKQPGSFLIESFDPDTYFQHTIGITTGEDLQPETVLLRVKKSQVPYFETQPLHSSQQKEKEYTNGDVLFSLKVTITIDLELLLMQYAHWLTVVSPSGLKDKLIHMIKEAQKNNTG
ncbi:MAG TPA: WYL domain-containing protein [Chitinophagaceae bacterium]|jgi:predicted DNA-binding transcriptional regulator YafY|nr:WYL domain-containing protein [Chitinophagaceae bacterium]